MKEEILFFNDKIYCLSTLRREVLERHHDNPLAGHFGEKRTIDLVQRQYYWPGLSTFVKSYVRGCHVCRRNKSSTHKIYGLLEPHPQPEGPWTRVGLDFITGLPPTKAKHDAILVIIDAYTKHAHFEPVRYKGLGAKETARLIRQRLIRYHGIPKVWITDRGSQFVNGFTKHLCKRLNVEHFPTTAYHPSGDGQTERVNAPLEAYLRAYVNYTQDDWDDWLDIAEAAYNNSAHAVTGVSPFYAETGRHPNFDIAPEAPGAPLDQAVATAHADKIQAVQTIVTEQLRQARARMGRYYNQRRQRKKFEVGDAVWLKTTNIRTRRSCKKLDHKKIGPFEIIERIGPLAYRLDLPGTLPIHNVFHVELLEKARDPVIDGQQRYPQGPVC